MTLIIHVIAYITVSFIGYQVGASRTRRAWITLVKDLLKLTDMLVDVSMLKLDAETKKKTPIKNKTKK